MIFGNCGFRIVRAGGGGAGGYLYAKADEPALNPHRTKYHAVHHYCLLEVTPQRCTLRAIDLAGREIDRRIWT